MSTAPSPVVTAFDWVPPFARGLVRDLRVRWAMEEIGAPYETELLNARAPRPEEYLARQPFTTSSRVATSLDLPGSPSPFPIPASAAAAWTRSRIWVESPRRIAR